MNDPERMDDTAQWHYLGEEALRRLAQINQQENERG